MKLEITFRKDEESNERLKRARACAQQLGAAECEWHGKRADVRVALDDQGELAWSVKNTCCDEFRQAIEKAIQDVASSL
jgi:hypothetical protein